MLHYYIPSWFHHYIIQYSLCPSLCPAAQYTRSEHAMFWITIIQYAQTQSDPERHFRVLMVLIVEGRTATSVEKSKIPAQRNDKMSMFCKSWDNQMVDGNYSVLEYLYPASTPNVSSQSKELFKQFDLRNVKGKTIMRNSYSISINIEHTTHLSCVRCGLQIT